MFDKDWYLKEYPDVLDIRMDPIQHYLQFGEQLGRNPSASFNTNRYTQNNPDVIEKKINPLVHYILSREDVGKRGNAEKSNDIEETMWAFVVDDSLQNGAKVSDRELHAYIDKLEESYADQLRVKQSIEAIQANLVSRNSEIRTLKLRLAEFKKSQGTIFEKSLSTFKKKYGPSKRKWRFENKKKWRKQIVSQLRQTRLVDCDWYLATYQDVANAPIDAVDHYGVYGVLEGRNPNAFFDTRWYISRNMDVASAGINPVIHYYSKGWKEGRDPSPLFSTIAYTNAHPELVSKNICPLTHFLENGQSSPTNNFNDFGGSGKSAAISDIESSTPLRANVFAAREFLLTETPILFRQFGPDNKFKGINRFHGISQRPVQNAESGNFSALELIPLSNEGFLEIPGGSYPKNHVLNIEVELESKTSGKLQLQFVTESDQQYNAEKQQERKFSIGKNTLQFDFGTTYLVGAQRLLFKGFFDPIAIRSISLKICPKEIFSGPLFSFVIPCFNHGAFVIEAVDSVRKIKEVEQYEIIVVDDGSTDLGCIEVLNRLRDEGVRLIRQKNQGLGSARNNGIMQARGRYILPVDADNKIRPVYFYRSIEIFDTDPETGVVFSDVQFFGEKSFRGKLNRHHFAQQFIQNQIDACAVFRREVWEQVGGYQEQMIGYQDWEFWTAVGSLKYWKFYHLKEIGFEYRVLPGSMVTHTRMFHEEILDFISARHVRNLRQSHAELRKKVETDSQGKSSELGAPVILSGPTDPLVSIIAPNFNKERYLPTRLDSLFKQTYRNFEVILLDDASNDESRTILERYADRYNNVQLIFNEENSGNVFKQWQKGIASAKGDVIWVAECDDYCDTEFLSKLIPHLCSPFNVGVAYCQSNFVNEKGHIFGNHLNILEGLDKCLWRNDFLMEGPEFVRRYMRRINCLPNASGILFHRHLMELIDWDEVTSYKVCGDWCIWVKLLMNSNIYFCAKPMNFFRFSQDTVRDSHSHDLSRVVEHLRIIEMIEKTVGLTDEQKEDALFCFRRSLQRHLDNNGANEDDLLNLLRKLYQMGGPVAVRLPADKEKGN